MGQFGKTLGEQIMEAAIREARIDWWKKRIGLGLMIGVALAVGKYLLT